MPSLFDTSTIVKCCLQHTCVTKLLSTQDNREDQPFAFGSIAALGRFLGGMAKA